MREQGSLKAAFKEASETVAKWENAQGFDPSEPQWVIGKNMELMLPQLEQHLFPQQGVIASAQSQNEKLDPAKP
jgi:hypothetical protein